MRFLTVAATALVLAATVRAAEPEQLAEALGVLERHAAVAPPRLTPNELTELARGRVVRRHERPRDDDGADRAVGLLVVEASREAAWLATQDPHGSDDASELHELRLSDSIRGNTRWFGLLDLPWPFRDRAWVVEVWEHTALAAASVGNAWEHAWRLDASGFPEAVERVASGELPGLAEHRARRAIFTPANRGSWTVVALGAAESLVLFQTETAIGGVIPDRLVARFALARMDALLQRIANLARDMPEHYVDGHPPIFGGDGKPLPCFASPRR